MALPDFANMFRGVIVINATAAREGKTEKVVLAGASYDEAASQLEKIAQTRAMILGRDAEVSYASVAAYGTPRAAQAVISNPIQGGLGVIWDDAQYREDDLNTNNPGATLRMRQETTDRENIMRQLVCVPDAFINASKYVGSPTPDVVDLGAYTTATTVSDIVLPTQTLWTFGDPVAGVTTHITWQNALKLYLKALHHFTVFLKKTTSEAGITLTKKPWTRLVYRGVGRVRLGRPILR